jgi:hypothetical protein
MASNLQKQAPAARPAEFAQAFRPKGGAMKKWLKISAPALAALILTAVPVVSQAAWLNIFGRSTPTLPEDPVEKAAIIGVWEAFNESTMYEIEPDIGVLRVQPMIPNESFLESHDPRELYCVCVQFEARYRVPWTTRDKSSWREAVRNILVMQTKGGHYMALEPAGICPANCR